MNGPITGAALLLAATASLLWACPRSAPRPPPPREEGYRFDGFRLGDLYGSKVMVRRPYRRPCDDDPIDRRKRRFMVYGALPCRGRTFPESTTVAFYLRYAKSAPYDQPIEAFAWMGGHYFDTRSNFPLRVGEPAARADRVLGGPVAAFRLRPWGRRLRRLLRLRRAEGRPTDLGLKVVRYRADVSVLVDRGTLVGFVVGPMPDNPESEQWRGLMQMYQRYTRRR